MGTYNCTIRTNYFRVKDEEMFRKLMDRVYGTSEVMLFERESENHTKFFGFGCYGELSGLALSKDEEDPDCEESSYEEFLSRLSQHVAEDDAVIIMEAGAEKMNYVVGSTIIITKNDIQYIDMTNAAIEKAKDMLGNPSWDTKCDY